MLNCENATRLMSESQERPLTVAERMPLKLHVMMCSGCRNFGVQMHVLRQLSHSYAKGAPDKAGKDGQ